VGEVFKKKMLAALVVIMVMRPENQMLG